MKKERKIKRNALTKVPQHHYFNDPGHGWVRVPLERIQLLGIENAISNYSYRNGNKVFLEEDQDVSTYAKALQKYLGLSDEQFRPLFNNSIKDHYTDRNSRIRNYNHYWYANESQYEFMKKVKELMHTKFRGSYAKRINNASLKECEHWNEYYSFGFKEQK